MVSGDNETIESSVTNDYGVKTWNARNSMLHKVRGHANEIVLMSHQKDPEVLLSTGHDRYLRDIS